MKIFGFNIGEWGSKKKLDVHSVDDLQPAAFNGQRSPAPWESSIFDGGKFAGGFGETQLQRLDYWTLRARSAQLFNENLYARGLIRRLITNEINTGLIPECSPDENIIGVAEDSLTEWSEDVENRFGIWAKSPATCDWKGQGTFGALQRAARMESLISGDVLVVLRQNARTKMPKIQLVSGSNVRTPLETSTPVRRGHEIREGVELDLKKKVVAYWVKQEDGTSKRLPAFGEKSGRRIAWLVFGTEKRLEDVRGTPLLSLVLQSLKEIDRYRDAATRKAVINSILAMFIKKTEDKMGTLPVSNGAVRRGQVTLDNPDGSTRKSNSAGLVPGMVMQELQQGEEPVGFGSQGTDINFGAFEESIVQTIAWTHEMPPEILRLSFSNNYSASQAAINEFKIYLNKVRSSWGEEFSTPIYIEWLLSETLLQKIVAPGLLQAWRNPEEYDVFGAWTSVEWYGSIKPSTDMWKQAKGSKLIVQEGWSTNAREARGITGTKFTKNMKRLKRENQLKVEAAMPMAEFEREFGLTVSDGNSVDNLEGVSTSGIKLLES